MEAASRPSSTLAKLLLILGLLLVANSAYIAAFGDPTLVYVANGLVHPVLGLLVGVLFAACFVRNRATFRGFLVTSAAVIFTVALALGIYLAMVGMTRPHSVALYAHVGTAIATLVLIFIWLGARARRASIQPLRDSRPGTNADEKIPGAEPARLSNNAARSAWRWYATFVLGSLVFYVAATVYHHYFPNPEYIIRNPATPPLSMEQEGGGANSFMFPSSAETADNRPIASAFFMNSESCRRCHADVYNQWQSSMHHFASFNNQWYRKSVEYMQDMIGIKPSLWCGGCHDHALILAGKMQKYPIRQIENTPEGQNGLGCMSCHAIVHVGSTMGQGHFKIQYPPLAEVAESGNPLFRVLHDYDVKLNPKPHRNAFLKPFHREPGQVPEFCSACHKVHLDVPVNHYRWLRGFDDYDNWQASGVSGQGARSFYYPPQPQNCVDCHMPLVRSKDFGNINGFVHSHRFAAANTAVPDSYGDLQQVSEVEKFLQGALSVDIFALGEEPAGAEQTEARATNESPQLASTFAVGEESSAGLAASTVALGQPLKLMAPLGRVRAQVRRGDIVRVEVVVRTRRVGHFFPGGTVDAFDCWLELQGRDSRGRMIFWSGEAMDHGKGPVDPGAHFYRSLQLDAHGDVINKRNAWSTRAAMYAHLIPPGAADTVHFRLKVPQDCGDSITLTARLNYRKFSWWNTHFAFAGVRDPAQPSPDIGPDHDDGRWVFTGDLAGVSAKLKQIPDVPTVVIGQNSVTIPVTARNAAGFAETIADERRDRERWNDYGIGLLLQGDLKGAERAFEKVTELDPKYADGWVNVARARIQEGNTEAAKPMLLTALKLNPNLASAHYFYGLALKADGDYPEAYNQFALAAVRYPHDRVNRNQMGRMLFLQRKYDAAVQEYQHTLSVDAEDLEAHYNLMLCYRGLGNDELASREERLYLRFKADEAARAITGPYKLAHPEDNNESQAIHEHESVSLGPSEGPKRYAEGNSRARQRLARRSVEERGTSGPHVQQWRARHPLSQRQGGPAAR